MPPNSRGQLGPAYPLSNRVASHALVQATRSRGSFGGRPG